LYNRGFCLDFNRRVVYAPYTHPHSFSVSLHFPRCSSLFLTLFQFSSFSLAVPHTFINVSESCSLSLPLPRSSSLFLALLQSSSLTLALLYSYAVFLALPHSSSFFLTISQSFSGFLALPNSFSIFLTLFCSPYLPLTLSHYPNCPQIQFGTGTV
jgi:hypothetical protein